MKKFTTPQTKPVTTLKVNLTKTITLNESQEKAEDIVLNHYAKAGFMASVKTVSSTIEPVTESQSYTVFRGNQLGIGVYKTLQGDWEIWDINTPNGLLERAVTKGTLNTNQPALFSYSVDSPYVSSVDLTNIIFTL
jgi:hypothetical protein